MWSGRFAGPHFYLAFEAAWHTLRLRALTDMFAINILDEPVPKEWLGNAEQAVMAEIVIDDFREKLEPITDDWSIEDYEKQWLDAVSAISAQDHSKSALITSFLEHPKTDWGAEIWPMYRDGNVVYIQMQYMQRRILPNPITKESIYKALEGRSKNVSEWRVELSDLQKWADNLKLFHS